MEIISIEKKTFEEMVQNLTTLLQKPKHYALKTKK